MWVYLLRMGFFTALALVVLYGLREWWKGDQQPVSKQRKRRRR